MHDDEHVQDTQSTYVGDMERVTLLCAKFNAIPKQDTLSATLNPQTPKPKALNPIAADETWRLVLRF